MFYPLEVSFFGNYICFGNRKEKIGSFGLSLLKYYKHNQSGRELDELNLKLLSGSNALRWRQNITENLPEAREAILATLDVLKRIKPFGWIDRGEITNLFSDGNIQIVTEHLPEKEKMPEAIPGQMALIDGLETDNALMLQAAALAEQMSEMLDFYSNLFEEIPQIYEKLRHLAQRYAWCERHDPVFLYALAFLDFEFQSAVASKTEYRPVLPPKGKKAVPGKIMCFSTYTDLILTELFEGLRFGRYPRLCRVCGKPFLMENQRKQIYCKGISPYKDDNGDYYSCSQQGAKDHEPQSAADEPLHAMYNTRRDTIRKQKNRGKISVEFAELARITAREYLERAIRIPAYAQTQYKSDIKEENLYPVVEAKLKKSNLSA